MGCIHPKGVKRVEKSTNRTRNYSGVLVGNNKTRVDSFERRDEVIVGRQGVSSIESSGDGFHHRGWESIELVNVRVPPRDGRPTCVTRRVPKAETGELVAAGWPVRLAVCAGEAIYGMVPRPLDAYEKLDKVGSGTYSTVYRVRDPSTGQNLALKKVRFDINSLPDSIAFMAREILILRKLDHPNVIKLEGIALSKSKSTLCLIFEYMEHDLLGLTACPDIKFSEPQVKCYMKQLLSGLEYCHAKGVMHRDIKGSNLLLNNEGILKIADFGLSNFFTRGEQLTTKTVTLWYRPPELLLGAIHYGPEVDLWSTGCVFAEILRGKPLLKGRNEVDQFNKIVELCGCPPEEYLRSFNCSQTTMVKASQSYSEGSLREKCRDLPKSAVDLLETLLSFEPRNRGTASSALSSEYFTTKPYACDTSNLPQYSAQKEIDVKARREAMKKRGEERARWLEEALMQYKNGIDALILPTESGRTNINNTITFSTSKEGTLKRQAAKQLGDYLEADWHIKSGYEGDSCDAYPSEVPSSGDFEWRGTQRELPSRPYSLRTSPARSNKKKHELVGKSTKQNQRFELPHSDSFDKSNPQEGKSDGSRTKVQFS